MGLFDKTKPLGSIMGVDPGHTHSILGDDLSASILHDYNDTIAACLNAMQAQAHGMSQAVMPSKIPKSLKGMSEVLLKNAIATRLRYESVGVLPFDFLAVHAVSDDKVVLLVVKDGKWTTIEDGALFPSDTLISQLRLLIDA